MNNNLFHNFNNLFQGENEIQHELFGKVHFAAKYKIKCSFFRKISYLTVYLRLFL